MKLFEQYQRMYDHYLGQPVQPGMAQLAALLGSGERNVRLQLGKMQARGWLNWQVARGRGHHSTLSFLQAPQTLRLARLQQLIEQGEMEHAFASLADNQRQALMARLPALLGARPMSRELRVALYRAPASLDPAHVSSRLESHLVRQVFDRLCGYDSQQQRLVPALAHYWEADDTARRWRFWLRPDVRFHDGSPLQAEAVAASVIRLRDEANPFQRQYRHLSAIEVHGPLSLSFILSDTDWLWPTRLVTASASIVPPRRAPDFAREPIGSGPFMVKRHNALRLSLGANPNYYRERPLLDQIDLWILPDQLAAASVDLQLSATSSEEASPLRSACSYLLLNPERIPDGESRRQLMRFLSQPALVGADDPARQAARGLLPEWNHPLARAPAQCPLPPGASLTLVCFELAGFQTLAAALARRLTRVGVQLRVRTLDYPEFERQESWWDSTDLVLSSELMHSDLNYACHEWLGGNRILRRALSLDAGRWLDERLLAIQCEPRADARMEGYRALGDWLVSEGWMLPLSHEQHRVFSHPEVAGLELGEGGWMDFSKLWLKL